MADKLSHIADDGSARMVDVSAKPVSRRWATAEATIALRPETVSKIEANQVAKGNVLATAPIAAIQAVKRTDELIPSVTRSVCNTRRSSSRTSLTASESSAG